MKRWEQLLKKATENWPEMYDIYHDFIAELIEIEIEERKNQNLNN